MHERLEAMHNKIEGYEIEDGHGAITGRKWGGGEMRGQACIVNRVD